MISNITPELVRKSAISVAIILGIAAIRAISGIIIPPRSLRGIPKVPLLPFLNALVRAESFENFNKKLIMPVLEKRGMACIWFAGRWGIFLSDPSYVKIFMSRTDSIPKVNALSQGKFIFDFFGEENVAVSNGEEWRRHRKVLNLAFRHTIPTEPFGECTHELFKYIDQAILHAETVDIPILMRRLTLDALGKTLFRFNFNALRNPENEYCKYYEGTFGGLANPVRILFPSADSIISLFEKHAVQSLAGLNRVVFDIIEKRKKEIQDGLYKNENIQHKDMLTMMIEAESHDDKNRWTTADIKNNLMVFFLAGHDTTQASLSVAIYYLALFPEIQKLARQEVDHIFSDSDPMQIPSVDNCRKMKYIDFIIKESLRMHPPAPNIGPRVVEEPVELDGVTIPKGTYLFADIYSLQHSSKYWKDPEKFWPERFYPENNPPKDAWLAFGGGSRICVSLLILSV
ncbi:uncharacterized protein VTP21DRAFT_2592 [Calcarisporiella thermophila]|uniref:uncharacterized protein n=1 Tax=Calcarisporiella thermophila TaxID=911321 RepID=UPI003743527B